NLAKLEELFSAGDVIDDALLHKKGVIPKSKSGLKILGSGELSKAFTVKATNFSASAKAKIEAAGGKCEIV
ncbi:MAG: uL15m family ribosomal protein, partial [Lentisphaerota bacterium]